jgi:[acyl-carrier-protein] S-malonyltransferase
MGQDLAATSELARDRYLVASDILGFDLGRICFEGPEEELRQTRVTQPALYVHSCILTELLAENGIQPSAGAGHSLGEYSALTAAGAFSFVEGLRLVKARAEAMQRAGEVNPGTMAAIVGLDDDMIAKLCRAASDTGTVVPANYNSPGQVVISGDIAAVRKAIELAGSMGAKLAKELNVSGAFHSPLMKPAAEALAVAVEKATINLPNFPVISNVTARPHADVEYLKHSLAAQLLSPVRWTESIVELNSVGDIRWFEIGSGNVLSGLLKRIIRGAIARPVGKFEDIEKISDDAGGLA